MRPTLYRIEREFGSHCCGEGGEFETLVLDCPLFTRARLDIMVRRFRLTPG
jgi:diphthine-ammonia ligase